jgi:hypothetical protein
VVRDTPRRSAMDCSVTRCSSAFLLATTLTSTGSCIEFCIDQVLIDTVRPTRGIRKCSGQISAADLTFTHLSASTKQ